MQGGMRNLSRILNRPSDIELVSDRYVSVRCEFLQFRYFVGIYLATPAYWDVQAFGRTVDRWDRTIRFIGSRRDNVGGTSVSLRDKTTKFYTFFTLGVKLAKGI